MTPLLYKKQVQIWLWHSLAKKLTETVSPVRKLKIVHFLTVIFQVPT
ncbi:Uncharacterised protein [Klebsiella pneumoniae]|nr:Uncharacterised protein [Klebsiella pneumoniae]SLR87401.1 Uncharacterised protein [Klebsiella pneumoniae]SLR96101.1 Uncharacterised protein [Klebsiella pneumoniae]SLS09156.1 Uncharacterised protein [Klebsiella pneumoniae]